jgi:hypothetical protein
MGSNAARIGTRELAEHLGLVDFLNTAIVFYCCFDGFIIISASFLVSILTGGTPWFDIQQTYYQK